jgi:hypothetical protein
MIEANPNKICWRNLSANPAAIHLINEMLEANPDKIDWGCLSENPEAIEILEANPDKINWIHFCFGNEDYDYYLKHIKTNSSEYILK